MKHKHGHSGWNPTSLGVLATLLTVLWVSGVCLYTVQSEFAAAWIDELLPWRRRMAVLHGIIAWCLTLWVGRHVWPHIHRCQDRPMTRRRCVAGWGLALSLLGLLLSAWGLMYGSAEGVEWARQAHFWPGLLLPMVVSAHGIGPSLQQRWPRRFAPRRPPS